VLGVDGGGKKYPRARSLLEFDPRAGQMLASALFVFHRSGLAAFRGRSGSTIGTNLSGRERKSNFFVAKQPEIGGF
jgi:hypothetical protein